MVSLTHSPTPPISYHTHPHSFLICNSYNKYYIIGHYRITSHSLNFHIFSPNHNISLVPGIYSSFCMSSPFSLSTFLLLWQKKSFCLFSFLFAFSLVTIFLLPHLSEYFLSPKITYSIFLTSFQEDMFKHWMQKILCSPEAIEASKITVFVVSWAVRHSPNDLRIFLNDSEFTDLFLVYIQIYQSITHMFRSSVIHFELLLFCLSDVLTYSLLHTSTVTELLQMILTSPFFY